MQSRRREQERLAKIEEEFEKRQIEASLAEKRNRLQAEDEAQTAKRRAKRMKKKEKKTTSKASNDIDGVATLLDLERLLDGEEETRRVAVERRLVLGMLPHFPPCVLEFEIGEVRNGY
jgi:hypothetical protein